MTVALGLDWSGGNAAQRKVWAARVDLSRWALLEVWRPFERCRGAAEVAAAVPGWLAAESFNVVGFDFCFGLARAHLQALGLPRAGPRALGRALQTQFAGPDDFKQAVGTEAKRATDVARQATFAPTNLRMYRQTYWGLRALAEVDAPIPPWTFGERAVVEVFPRHVRRTSGVSGLKISDRDAAIIAADPEHDALDAALAALAAGSSLLGGFSGAPPDAAASGEGWIYSVV